MDISEVIKKRRSIRKYLSKEVEEEKIRKVLEGARWAPSASNKQPWHFIVVRNSETRKKLADLHSYGRFMAESPVVIIVLGDPSKHQKYHLADPHNAVENMILQACSLGLSTCWIGVRDTDVEDDFKQILVIPSELRVICAVAMGYSDMERESSRVPFDDIVSWESFGNKG